MVSLANEHNASCGCKASDRFAQPSPVSEFRSDLWLVDAVERCGSIGIGTGIGIDVEVGHCVSNPIASPIP
ncbi:hypothetical protein D3OALGA1CA_3064 [Olavius algarvensis associated proteobacterium Delta 3]|nr:hypothetical protein D3OALGA1CA_3064 [Olavius algarvensis associated proteobacterium Delta 3]CAB5158076.1 hypothetical protein D3OALGB2SA_5244 [Olavius algarvensis associated proteobacterium Delta 3]